MKKIAVTGHSGRVGFELIKLGCIPFKANVISKVEIQREVDNEGLSFDLIITDKTPEAAVLAVIPVVA